MIATPRPPLVTVAVAHRRLSRTPLSPPRSAEENLARRSHPAGHGRAGTSGYSHPWRAERRYHEGRVVRNGGRGTVCACHVLRAYSAASRSKVAAQWRVHARHARFRRGRSASFFSWLGYRTSRMEARFQGRYQRPLSFSSTAGCGRRLPKRQSQAGGPRRNRHSPPDRRHAA